MQVQVQAVFIKVNTNISNYGKERNQKGTKQREKTHKAAHNHATNTTVTINLSH